MTAMAGTKRHNRTQGLASKAEKALAGGDVFEAEAAALKALLSARAERDYAAMADAVPTLLQARQRRLSAALAVKHLKIISESIGEDIKVVAGCYLVQPPQVAADARRLRLAAFEQRVPIAVVCREPLTQIRLQPIVAISPGTTVRTKVRPPKDIESPDITWFTESLKALGDFAVDTLDAALAVDRRVDALMDRLDAISEHEGLHQALQQACVAAAEALARSGREKALPRHHSGHEHEPADDAEIGDA